MRTYRNGSGAPLSESAPDTDDYGAFLADTGTDALSAAELDQAVDRIMRIFDQVALQTATTRASETKRRL